MMKRLSSRTPRVPVSRRLRRELRLTAIVAGVAIGFTAVGVVHGQLDLPFVVLSLLGGAVCGAVLSRAYRLRWDAAANEVVARLDRVGAAILVGYLVFVLARLHVASPIGPDAHLSLAPLIGRFALTAGIAVGRLFVSLAWINTFASVVGVRPDS